MARHQADAHLEVLGRRLLAQLEHPARGRAVGRHRLFHEDVQALLDGVAEMHPAEGQRRGEDGDVARLQAIHRLLVGVETDELAILGHVDLVGELLLELLVAAAEAVLEDVGHGDQLDRPLLDRQGVGRRAGAAAAAADQGHLDRVVLGGMDGGTAMPARVVAAATWPVFFRNSRREETCFVSLMADLLGVLQWG